MKHDDNFLARDLAAPQDLEDILPLIERLYRERRPKKIDRRRRLVLGSTSVLATSISIADQHPERGFEVPFVDASRVRRRRKAITRHLERLIAPKAFATVRPVVLDYLAIIELDETAGLTVKLAKKYPAAATALLELRPGRAQRRLKEAGAPLEFLGLVEEYHRIRIARGLTWLATDCWRQIHNPTRWSRLDDLDRVGTPRFCIIYQRILHELEITEYAFELFLRNRRQHVRSLAPRREAITGMFGPPTTLWRLNVPATEAEARPFVICGVESRARMMLAIWRRMYGGDLEAALETKIRELKREIERIRRGLEARNGSTAPNAIIGNIATDAALLRLWFAVEEAVHWCFEATGIEGSFVQAMKTACSHDASIPESPIGRGIRWRSLPSRERGPLPLPDRERDRADQQAHMVVYLFTALRFAFVQDNEMLPYSLRNVRDPRTGQQKTCKSLKAVADLTGRTYTFRNLWAAFRWEQRRKIRALPRDATPAQRAEAVTPTNSTRKKVQDIRNPKKRSDPMLIALSRAHELRPWIKAGFTAI